MNADTSSKPKRILPTFTILVTEDLKHKAQIIADYSNTSVNAWLIENHGKQIAESIEARYNSIPPEFRTVTKKRFTRLGAAGPVPSLSAAE